MKKIIIMSLLASITVFAVIPKETFIAEKSLLLGMHIQENKEKIVDWGKFYSFKVLQNELEGVDCNIKPSDDSNKEFYRGLCEFVNSPKNSLEFKQSTMEGMNAIAYAATTSKNPKYMCAFALTQYTIGEWNKADFILSRVSSFGNNELCKIAKELPKTAIRKSLKTHKDASDECAIQK